LKKEVIIDLFFISTILQNLTGIEKKFYWRCEFRGCNFFFFSRLIKHWRQLLMF
jgi:hypothetical protein